MSAPVRIAAYPLALLLSCILPLAAQTGYLPPNPVTPPTVSPPALTPQSPLSPPSVTAPTVTGVSAGAQTGATSGGSASAAPSGGTATGSAASVSPSAAASSAGTAGSSVSALSLLGLGDGNALVNALSGKGGDEASLDALSSLLGGGSDASGALSALSGSGAAKASSADSETLRKILELLEKQQASSASGATATSAGNRTPAVSAAKADIASGGELLRFSVNGYNVAGTVTTLVSSILAKDGSFLITGDRRYPAGNRWASETFYLLCRKTGAGTYRLYADVSQDSPNPNSYLRQLAARSPIAGTLTGDLLVFRSPALQDWNLDLVIRVHSPIVRQSSDR